MKNDHSDTVNWLPLSMASEILGSTPLNVLMHVKRGHLAGSEGEGGWLVDPVSLAALLEKRQQGETAAVCSGGCSSKAGGCGSCP